MVAFKKLCIAGLIALIGTSSVVPTGLAKPEPIDNTVFTAMDVQTPVGWGLDQIDGTLDNKYNYISDGQNVRIYIVDTGVDSNHPDLVGRVDLGFDAFNEGLSQSDCNGHGTHVAGVVAGTKYGVAKKATIVPVRVLNCTAQGNTSTLLAGVEWILKTHPVGSVGVVNMSLGGSKSDQANSAVEKLVSAGLIVVAAAGNSNVDACSFSPASANGVIAVGAIDESNTRYSASNWGSCVDIYAPGTRIVSANSKDYLVPASRSGTSVSSPFVSGLIATYISEGISPDSNAAVQSLQHYAIKDAVIGSKSSPTYTAKASDGTYNPSTYPGEVVQTGGNTNSYQSVSKFTATVPGSKNILFNLTVTETTAKSATFAWNPVNSATKYLVSVGRAGSNSVLYKFSVSEAFVKVYGLSAGNTYWAKVTAYKSRSALATSELVSTYIAAGIPGAPKDLRLDGQTLHWAAPTYDGGYGGLIYSVEKLSGDQWALVSKTRNLYLNISNQPSGTAETYRVKAATEGGAGLPSNELQVSTSIGVPVTSNAPTENVTNVAGSVSVTQSGVGSWQATISWALVPGVSRYRVQKVTLGSDIWTPVAIVTGRSYLLTVKPGIKTLFKVTTETGNFVGIGEYLGN